MRENLKSTVKRTTKLTILYHTKFDGHFKTTLLVNLRSFTDFVLKLVP